MNISYELSNMDPKILDQEKSISVTNVGKKTQNNYFKHGNKSVSSMSKINLHQGFKHDNKSMLLLKPNSKL